MTHLIISDSQSGSDAGEAIIDALKVQAIGSARLGSTRLGLAELSPQVNSALQSIDMCFNGLDDRVGIAIADLIKVAYLA